MGTEEPCQCLYSGNMREYGNREALSMPIVREHDRVWEQRSPVNAYTQATWGSMGTEKLRQCP